MPRSFERTGATLALRPTIVAALLWSAAVPLPHTSGQLARAQERRPARPPDIYFVPTREAVADAMLALARVSRDDIVYDLGSGDGRIVMLAAQKYGARGVGIELDPRLVDISRQVARDGEVEDKVRFVEGDLFAADISEATVVTLYLSPGINRQLEGKLRRELKPGARIVSHQFPIGTWTPDQTVRAEDGTDLHLWVLRGSARFFWVLQGSARFSRVLRGSS